MELISKKRIIPILSLFIILSALLFRVDVYAVFSVNPTVRTGYTVYVNGNKTQAQYIATYSGTAYVPLNQIAYDLRMNYTMKNNTAIFSYQDRVMTVDYEKNNVSVNGVNHKLQFGTVKKTINGQTYLFFNVNDIQNIFGIVTRYKEQSKEIFLDSGFGILDVSYDIGVNSMAVNDAKQKLFTYANNIATKIGGVIIEKNEMAYNSLNNLFESINAPISQKEFVSGIEVKGISTNTASKEVIQHFLNLKFLVGLSKLSVKPEYFGCYELSDGKNTMQIIGAFYNIDGLQISNADLGVSAVATIEDTLSTHLDDKAAKEVSDRISVSASSARSVQHFIIATVQNGEIKVIEVF